MSSVISLEEIKALVHKSFEDKPESKPILGRSPVIIQVTEAFRENLQGLSERGFMIDSVNALPQPLETPSSNKTAIEIERIFQSLRHIPFLTEIWSDGAAVMPFQLFLETLQTAGHGQIAQLFKKDFLYGNPCWDNTEADIPRAKQTFPFGTYEFTQ